MRLYVNNQPVVLKTGTVVDYTVENPLFKNTEGWTLTITIPLKDCPQNLALFGNLQRVDIASQTTQSDYAAVIEHGNFRKEGILRILEVNEAEISAQFLDGLAIAAANNPLDEIYINEQIIREPADAYLGIAGEQYYRKDNLGWNNGMFAYCFPWINNSSGIVQNLEEEYQVRTTSNHIKQRNVSKFSWQVNMLWLTQRLIEALGQEWDWDLSEWNAHEQWRYLICMNTLPAVWEITNICRALPHWTYTEYFKQLEILLGGKFDIDTQREYITFHFNRTPFVTPAYCKIPAIFDAHTVEIAEDENTDSFRDRIIKFAENTLPVSKYDLFDLSQLSDRSDVQYVDFTDMSDMQTYFNNNHAHFVTSTPATGEIQQPPVYRLTLANDGVYYFVPYIYNVDASNPLVTTADAWLVSVGYHGTRADLPYEQKECKFTPVPFMHGEYCFLPFLECGDYDNAENVVSEENPKTNMQMLIEQGEQDQETHSKIFIAFFKGAANTTAFDFENDDATYPQVSSYQRYFPVTKHIQPAVWGSWLSTDEGNGVYATTGFDLLNPERHRAAVTADIPETESRITLKCKFFADTLPDTKQIFLIENQPYLCTQLKTQFAVNPLQQDANVPALVIDGEFKPIKI